VSSRWCWKKMKRTNDKICFAGNRDNQGISRLSDKYSVADDVNVSLLHATTSLRRLRHLALPILPPCSSPQAFVVVAVSQLVRLGGQTVATVVAATLSAAWIAYLCVSRGGEAC
jgi:hypothetical protein